jgi:type I restriction enzyme S subunit
MNYPYEIIRVSVTSCVSPINDGTYPLYSLTLEEGITPKTDRYNREFLLNDAESNEYKIVYPGDIVYNPMNLRFGALAVSNLKFPIIISAYYNVIQVDKLKLDVNFLANLLLSPRLMYVYERIASGSLIEKKRVHFSEFRNILLPLPPLPEQRKIAEILSSWDKAIELLEQLITAKRKLKQGLMQQLLTGKKRFKEFESSKWETYHFKEIFKRVTRKNTIGNSNILTISGNHGLINQRDFFNKRIAADKLDGYYLLKKGEFAYNKSYSNGYPLGAIKRLDRYEAGVLSTLYICFKISNPSVNSDFLAHYFEAGILNQQIYGIAQEGARNHGLLNISVTDFFEILLRLPSLSEQQKIASILSTADTEISTLEKQLAAYKQQKRGLMQQLLTGKKRVKIEENN